jgi:serine/threonine-protein kinase
VLRCLDRAILTEFGAAARAAALARLDGKHADDVRAGAINALVSYDLETLDAYLELASIALVRDRTAWRRIGREAVDGELAGFLRAALRPAPDLAAAVRRGVSVWQRLFSFGSWRVVASGSGEVTVHVAEFEAASLSLRQWVVGVIEATCERAVSRPVRGTISAGAGDFERELSCELALGDGA